MRFGLSSEQETFRDQLRRLLAERAPLARVREVAAEGSGYDQRLWSGLTELGAMGVLVPEDYGGLGLGAFEAGLVLEELGRFVAPAPYLGTAFVAPLVLAESGSNGLAAEWLPRIAAGEARVGLALAEAVGAREGAGVRNAGGRLSGKALAVLDAGAADAFLTAADGELWWVRSDAHGLLRTPMTSIDRTRALAELRFEAVEAEPVAGGATLTRRALDLARVALAADTLGAADAMLEQATAYSKQRVQFERVIGSFQGVKHALADMVTALEPARALVWYATHAQTTLPGPEAHRLACHAKAHLAEVGRMVARGATEVHGGMGFTDDLGLHVWFKRIGLDRQLLGSPEQIRAEAAAALAAA
ncbi:MAG: acyl-CoA/acyl-ACP dehydrogenase [Alphaproteobacteria bacterium]|nr:acyl-CoA/acyl-ACP dehydrogenase [Alphaproteobacteria bacterium]MCB9928124.1 acyl-CoA/acyl-ACP dehydrogenase [Alphaproteobacteria bacterium]